MRTVLTINLPIIIKNSTNNHKGLFLNPHKLSSFIKISDKAILRLTGYFLIEDSFVPKPIRRKIASKSQAIEYNKLLKDGTFKNKAEIAKATGVSRAWITKVMNQLK